MPPHADALAALADALSCSETKHREVEEAWIAALVEAAGTRYEQRLREASALNLEKRQRVLDAVRGILEGFEA